MVIYHGTRATVSGSLYRVGMVLLDLDEPWKIINRCNSWIFGPHEPYERIGDVPGVTFPCGVVLDKQRKQLKMYYGAADTTVCLATANIDDLVQLVLSGCS